MMLKIPSIVIVKVIESITLEMILQYMTIREMYIRQSASLIINYVNVLFEYTIH